MALCVYKQEEDQEQGALAWSYRPTIWGGIGGSAVIRVFWQETTTPPAVKRGLTYA